VALTTGTVSWKMMPYLRHSSCEKMAFIIYTVSQGMTPYLGTSGAYHGKGYLSNEKGYL
jgi:hypothetical protein